MYELLWFLFLAIIGGILTLKKRIVEYMCKKLNETISTYRVQVYVIIQYFAICFKKII